MKKLLTRLIHRLPNRINNVFYNQSNYIEAEKFPVIFDENGEYIDCRIGVKSVMLITKCGKKAYYEVVKIRTTRGSDWLYPSDAINCDFKFSHV